MLKIEISINIEIVLFIILFILTKRIGLYVMFLFFVLIHELSHVALGIILGFKPQKFMIMPFGFKVQFQKTQTNKNIEYKKIAVAIIGPAINLLLMLIAIILKLHTNIIFSNLIIAVFNLIPIYPLDGGRILKSILNVKLEPQRAYKIVNRVSNISIVILTAISSIVVLYIKNIGIVFTLAYLWYVVIRENKRYKIIKRVYDVIENN